MIEDAPDSRAPGFAELCALSNFTFLTGASHAEEMVGRAAELGLAAVAIADRNTLAGVVRGHAAARDLNKRAAARIRESDSVTTQDVIARAEQRYRKRDASDRATVMVEGPALTETLGWDGRFLVASRLALEDSPVEWVALPQDRAAYARLCRLLTLGKRRTEKGKCRLLRADLEEWGAGLVLLALTADPLDGMARPHPDPPPQGGRGRHRRRRRPNLQRLNGGEVAEDVAPPPLVGGGREGGDAAEPPPSFRGDAGVEPGRPMDRARHGSTFRVLADGEPRNDIIPDIANLARRFPGCVFLAARPAYDGRDEARLEAYARLAEQTGAPMVASADPIMHAASRRRLADVLSCIREKTDIDRLGAHALPNAERRLRSGAEMARLFRAHRAALDRSVEIAARCRFSLDQLRYEYPDEVSTDPETGAQIDPQTRLEALAWEGLSERYPDGAPERVRAQCDRELKLIEKLDYARYFLTVRDVVAFAESREILVQGRGSAANSVVCYALRITAIGPEIGAMVFERFVSEARGEPPDIDVDFEHERREEVIQHIYAKYGRERAGLCATVIHFRARAAIREVGKAMGLSQDVLAAIAGQVWGVRDDGVTEARLREIGLDPSDRRLRQTLQLIDEIIGFPRHLSQHVGGFIITRGRLDELCPIENAAMEDRTVIEWDKDDIDTLGILKIDVLSLGMLTCIRKALDLIAQHQGPRYTLATIPPEDPAVYDMLCEGDSIGVFQVESRAQMNFLPRMRPRTFYDLVIEVAIVRPGPIQGDMVHPFIRRRQGAEQVSFPSQELEEVLGKTLGVPLFQEQAMQIAIVGAGFSPEESDLLRRSLATFRKTGTIHTFRERFVGGMTARGYDEDFAGRCFSQIEGFGEYGFPESHAASFALLVYASAWLKKHHPAAFACALLNSQPMGFYAPAQIVRDARAHGVTVRPVCVNASYWDNTLEPDGAGNGSEGLALRLGFRQVKGFSEDDAAWIAAARGNGYRAVEDVWRRAGAQPAALERLAEADAFQTLSLTRRDALWAAKGVKGAAPAPLFADLLEGEGIVEPPAALPPASLGEEVVEDYLSLRLTLRAHPLALLRDRLTPAPASSFPDSPQAGTRKVEASEPHPLPDPPPQGGRGREQRRHRHNPGGDASGDALADVAPPPLVGRGREGGDAAALPRPPSCLTAAQLGDAPPKALASVAGLVIVRQRPGSAKGVIFLTLEDETGVANIVVWSRVSERFRRAVIGGRLLRVTGRVQREGEGKFAVIHVVAETIEDLSDWLDTLSSRAFGELESYADEGKRPQHNPRGAPPRAMHPREQSKRLFPSRDFH